MLRLNFSCRVKGQDIPLAGVLAFLSSATCLEYPLKRKYTLRRGKIPAPFYHHSDIIYPSAIQLVQAQSGTFRRIDGWRYSGYLGGLSEVSNVKGP